MENNWIYVVLNGRLPHTDKSLTNYVAHIVYGDPVISAFAVSDEHFVALCEYPRDDAASAGSTFHRMGSFGLGAQYAGDAHTAFAELGAWACHYARTPAPTHSL